MAERLIVFVCTGNMCRSPMAEYLLRGELGDDEGWQVASAGLAAAPGLPASHEAEQVLAEKGIDASRHMSRPLDSELVNAASLLIVMTAAHRDQIRETYRSPLIMQKVFLLRSFDPSVQGGDIDDPIGMSIDVYRGVRDEIAAALPGLRSFMASLEFWR